MKGNPVVRSRAYALFDAESAAWNLTNAHMRFGLRHATGCVAGGYEDPRHLEGVIQSWFKDPRQRSAWRERLSRITRNAQQ